MGRIDELEAKIKELEAENKKLTAKLKKKEKDLIKQIEEYNKLNNSFVEKNADYIELEQLRFECKRFHNMAETWKNSALKEQKQHEKTKNTYERLKKQYEELKNQLQKQPINQENSNIDKQSDIFSEMDNYFCISPQMQASDIKKAQKTIAALGELLTKVGINMRLTDEKILTCFFNPDKMKKIAIRNEKGAKRKNPKTNKPIGEYLTYDEVKEMMKTKTAEQVAKEFGFTKMTLYRKLKQAEQREDKSFK